MKFIPYIITVAMLFAGCTAQNDADPAAALRTIDSLRTEIARRNAEIDVLREQLFEYKSAAEAVAADSMRCDSLASDSLAAAVAPSLPHAESDLLLLDAAYYVVGRKSELMRKGVIKRTFPLVGRWRVEQNRRLDDTFHRVDTSRPVTFTVNSLGARLISTHPEGSYTVVASKGGKYWHELQVTDPEGFWAETKVMVLAYD